MRAIVLDTNVVLDLLVFGDPAVAPVREGLAAGALRWIGTTEMRDELARVLAYPKLALRVAHHRSGPEPVLADYDAGLQLVDVAPRAPVRCGDPDDQKFIDLAVAHGAILLSKDFEVLRMRKRLAALSVAASAAWIASGDTA